MKTKSPAKILVIEDEEEDWFLITKAFNQGLPKLSLVRAASLSEVLNLLRQWQNQEWDLPTLIFQDLYLPTRQQGFEVLTQLKGPDSPCRHVPIMMLSSSDQSTDIETAYRLGISSYLIKPTLLRDWMACIEQLRIYWLETVTLPPLRFGLTNDASTSTDSP